MGTNQVFDFTIQANLSRSVPIGYEVTAIKLPINDVTPLEDNEVKLYLEKVIDPDTTYKEVMAPKAFIPSIAVSEIGSPIGSMVLDFGNITNTGATIYHYRLRMWINESTLIPSGETRKYGVKINVYAKQDVVATPVTEPESNPNILAIYQYNQNRESSTFCVTGEEETCQSLAPQATYREGTIIKYQVNDSEEKYFHVISDNGDTLMLQQRENTVYSTAWYADANDNTKGPLTVLEALENATSGWSNVLDQTYTMGTTIFKDNAFTGCSYDLTTNKFTCAVNTYTLESSTAKSRMISVQEAHNLGCLAYDNGVTNGTCPVWMYNYLINSTSNGGTVDEAGENEDNNGYLTMNANSNVSTHAWGIRGYGVMSTYHTGNTKIGGRAVVMINK